MVAKKPNNTKRKQKEQSLPRKKRARRWKPQILSSPEKRGQPGNDELEVSRNPCSQCKAMFDCSVGRDIHIIQDHHLRLPHRTRSEERLIERLETHDMGDYDGPLGLESHVLEPACFIMDEPEEFDADDHVGMGMWRQGFIRHGDRWMGIGLVDSWEQEQELFVSEFVRGAYGQWVMRRGVGAVDLGEENMGFHPDASGWVWAYPFAAVSEEMRLKAELEEKQRARAALRTWLEPRGTMDREEIPHARQEQWMVAPDGFCNPRGYL